MARACGFFGDGVFEFLEFGEDGLDFFGEPSVAAVDVAAAAGGLLAVAVEEGPVGGEPILLPKGILF